MSKFIWHRVPDSWGQRDKKPDSRTLLCWQRGTVRRFMLEDRRRRRRGAASEAGISSL